MRALRASAGIVLVIGLLLVLGPAAASAAVLYDQTDHSDTFGFASEDDANNSFDDQIADDFTVPAGQTWQIATVNVLGTANPGYSPNVNVFVYRSAGSKPGAEVFHELNVPTFNGPNFVIPLGGPVLTPGDYWVSVQDFAGDVGGGTAWAWTARTVQSGQLPVIRNPGGGYGAGACADWATTSCTGGGSAAGFLFRLDGTTAPYTPPSTGPTTHPNNFSFGGVVLNKDKGTATLSISVPGPGTVNLSGKGIVGRRPARLARAAARKVTKAGTVKLLVKAKGKAKRKLNKTGKVKVKAKVTFKPTGGTAKTERKPITLKKTLKK